MRTFPRLVGAIALGVAVSSCTQVSVTEPFGTEPAELNPEAWNGVWRADHGDRGRIEVSKDKPGEFVFSGVPDPEAAPEEESDDLTVAVRDVGGDLYFTVIGEGDRNAGDGEEGGLLWGRIAINENSVLVWLPDVGAFATLVKNGTLPGKDTRKKNKETGAMAGGIELGNLEANHIEAIAKETHGVLFYWDEPMVFVRDPWKEEEEEEPDSGE